MTEHTGKTELTAEWNKSAVAYLIGRRDSSLRAIGRETRLAVAVAAQGQIESVIRYAGVAEREYFNLGGEVIRLLRQARDLNVEVTFLSDYALRVADNIECGLQRLNSYAGDTAEEMELDIGLADSLVSGLAELARDIHTQQAELGRIALA